MSAEEIRTARTEHASLRERDFAEKFRISEAQLLAAYVGDGVTRIEGSLDRVMEAAPRLGEVMGLTRNESCVIEKVGLYDNFRSRDHAGLIINEEIDLRMFPRNWVHGFAVEKQTDSGVRRSLQVFDAAGDAVHKIFLRETSEHDAWDEVVGDLTLDEQSDTVEVSPRKPVEDAIVDDAKAEALHSEWDQMNDTHQFMGITKRLKINRLGAYRMAGAPYVRQLENDAVDILLKMAADQQTPIMVFVGNMGCIEIHTGPILELKTMGPWLNVLDPRFNLHLRGDHIAEVYAVSKNTRRGPAISVEAFRKDGLLIAQFFGVLRGEDRARGWNRIVAGLPSVKDVEVA
jgi:putative hemin transport protein